MMGRLTGSIARPLRRAGHLLALAAVVAPGGCGDGTGPGSGDVLALSSARAKWRDAGIAYYAYNCQRSCFCPESLTELVRLTVAGDAVIQVVSLRGSSPGPYEVGLEPQYYPTVEQLFDVVAEAIREDAHRLEVDYDHALGYPRRIAIDRDVHAVDDELLLTAGGLTPLELSPLDARAAARRGLEP